MATGKMAKVDTELVRGDGSRFPVSIKAFPLFAPNGSSSGFIELVEDISQARETEKGFCKAQGGGRGGQPRQERIPGQHEPRNPHAHVGDSGVQRPVGL